MKYSVLTDWLLKFHVSKKKKKFNQYTLTITFDQQK